MKTSNYNFFYDFPKDSDKMIAYNSRTNSLALIEKENYLKYEEFVNKFIPIDDKNLIEDLKKGEFLIEEEINELDLLRFNLLNSRFYAKSLGITIAPTMNCNFDCIYCYEKDKREGLSMSEEVKNKLINFIEKQSKYVDNIYITWYGGEPLLAFDIIKDISKQVLKICDKHNIKYNSSLVTNGYKLNNDIVEELKNINIDFVQVTIDGPEEIHDNRRPLNNGQGTFYKILKNLSENIHNLPNISLRINVDKENINRVNEVLKVLDEFNLKEKIYVYLGYVEPINDCYSSNNCLSFSEYSQTDYEFQSKLLDLGFISDTINKYPSLVGNFCTADSVNSFLVDPKGDIYKCWSDIGRKEYKIGSLLDNELENRGKYMNYMVYDATMDKECSKCKVLPLCMGGCPRTRLDKKVDRCSIYKYMLEKYIKDISQILYEKKEVI